MGGVVKLKPNQEIDADDTLLVYVHIPKTGGTSVHAALGELFGPRYANTNDPAAIANLDGLQAIGGHFGFEGPGLRACQKSRVYSVIVREPVERFISFYRHVVSDSHHYISVQYPYARLKDPKSFAEFLMKIGNEEIRNQQCSTICGRDGATSDEAIELLKSSYSFFCESRYQNIVLGDISRAYGRPRPSVRRLNVGSTYYQVDLDEKLAGFIRDINEQDTKLYEYVVRSTVPPAGCGQIKLMRFLQRLMTPVRGQL